MTINPFDLFGIEDPNKISLSQLKRAYYDLALLVHPDRNHHLNGEEMDVVHKAYLYCREQLEHAESKQTSVEELEKAFEEFCDIQKETPPAFRDIADDVLELQKFNREFEASDTPFLASYRGGYGDFMDSSEYAAADSNQVPLSCVSYDTVEEKPLQNDFSSIIVYKEPIVASTSTEYFDYTKPEPIKNYTTKIKQLVLTDYQEANTKEDLQETAVPEKTLEQLLEERAALDQQISEIAKPSFVALSNN